MAYPPSFNPPDSDSPQLPPPSFAPRTPSKRPSAQGAHRVGRDGAPASPTRQPSSVPERVHVVSRHAHVQQQSSARPRTPAAYVPRRSSAQPFSPAHTRAAQRTEDDARLKRYRTPQARGRAAGISARAARISPLRSIRRFLVITLVLLLALTLLWIGYLYSYGNGRLTHVNALSGAPNTPGTTYLIVGSDQRAKDSPDPTEGMRSDTIMLLHKPAHGAPALISIPRDSWVAIPGNGHAKINAAFSWGGQKLLVQTVEQLTGLTVDHYVQIGMNGVEQLTDAVGGIQLCITDKNFSFPISDRDSGLTWEKSGCETANGAKALAFSRMRQADPQGDLGRTKRQRQVVGAILRKALSPTLFINPFQQKHLVGSTADALTVDSKDSLMDIASAGLALRTTMGTDGLLGTPPISSLDYWVDGQSAVQLDPDRIDDFWKKVREGTLTKADFIQPTE
ncbi:MAG: LCP family protein [Actinomycetaceae bacterium]|nr:LCP family protein [Actinomycetaceae bacterium]MDY5273902.1 LCP family protein [Arcanobacterium sp.]